MKEKSQIEKNAAQKQVELLSLALSSASEAGGHWLNAAGKRYPRLYPQGVSASPFNALFMALHSDSKGCKTNLFTLYTDATRHIGTREGTGSTVSILQLEPVREPQQPRGHHHPKRLSPTG